MLGLPSFRALHQQGRQISLAGPDKTAAACRGLFSPPYWPLDLDKLPADIHDLALHPVETDNETNPSPEDTLVWGQLSIRCMKVNHPGGCLAYHIEDISSGKSFLFATDMEWALMGEKHKKRFLDFSSHPQGPTVLAMDGHLTDEEYSERSGWGHSTQEEVVSLGQTMGCEHIFITHHSPENDDDELDKRRLAVKKLESRADLIKQGLTIDLT